MYFSAEIDDNDKCEELIKDLFESSGPSPRDIAQGILMCGKVEKLRLFLKIVLWPI